MDKFANKILFLLHVPPPVHGSSVIGMQIKNSIKINEEFDCRYVDLGTSTSIDEIGKGGFVKLFRFAAIWFSVLRLLITFRPKLCYFAITAKGPAFYKDASIALLFKIFGVKLVYHFHNKGVSSRQDKWLDNLLYRIIFKNEAVILLSKHLYPDIQKYVSKERIHFCPNGIPDVSGSNSVLVLKEDKTIVNILFLSNLIESKGVFVLLDACKILNNKQAPFHCTFVGGIGDVNEEQFNDEVQKLDIENHVAYLGKKFGIEKRSEFEKADIFILPTINDCFPLVLLEAMQHSLPIISTFEGGIPDIVEDEVTGFLVQQKDAMTLANKLEILINNPEMRLQMGVAGREKYEKEFTLDTFETTLTYILNTVLK
jgi:glycosyltransferase involved in cell wall biosynthesis